MGQVTVVDYGVGNLFSLQSSLKALGLRVIVSGREEDLREAKRIIAEQAEFVDDLDQQA